MFGYLPSMTNYSLFHTYDSCCEYNDRMYDLYGATWKEVKA